MQCVYSDVCERPVQRGHIQARDTIHVLQVMYVCMCVCVAFLVRHSALRNKFTQGAASSHYSQLIQLSSNTASYVYTYRHQTKSYYKDQASGRAQQPYSCQQPPHTQLTPTSTTLSGYPQRHIHIATQLSGFYICVYIYTVYVYV